MKDMRSPAMISFCDIRYPPAYNAPSTKPTVTAVLEFRATSMNHTTESESSINSIATITTTTITVTASTITISTFCFLIGLFSYMRVGKVSKIGIVDITGADLHRPDALPVAHPIHSVKSLKGPEFSILKTNMLSELCSHCDKIDDRWSGCV